MGPPVGVALDARQVGNKGQFMRIRCCPNVVLRPVLCEWKGEETLGFGGGVWKWVRRLRLGRNRTMGMQCICYLSF